MTEHVFRREATDGFRAILPVIIAAVPIGFVFGAVATGKGLSSFEVTLMSALVFAGGSQFVAMDLWTHPASWTALGFAALLVNLRHVLMGASLERSLGLFRPWQKLPTLLIMADENWALAEVRARTTALTPAYYLGLALPFYLGWVASSLAGALFGALIGDITVYGLDFAFPALFIVLLTGFWKGRETGLVLAASGLAALTVHALVPGAWYIAAGALAGLAAAFIPLRQKEQPA
ncbi:4-azaleucine resistance transporter AzlC [Peteryoungia aggregata LMG 23059]|uniref:4-azaleucine resistance transporter AzlC n=1 Tax=Peteryoungia aggregata LMG 23059 TaxID=1368425 RepID=A0ABU0G8Z6_9HYPH|nr:AzlC family ABC transporter permease [Peteryoungia aggregata]MDQ0421797.1 4-azaleucine resistance transporter AzlC [Peteryoungia aggregata LMG 23059]